MLRFTRPLNKKIELELLHTYGVQVKVDQVKRGIGFAGPGMFQYNAYFTDDPLSRFGGYYKRHKRALSSLNIEQILFEKRCRQSLQQLFNQEQVVVHTSVYAMLPDTTPAYDRLNLIDFARKYGLKGQLTLHVYLFQDVDWNQLLPLQQYFEALPELSLSLVISFYPKNLCPTQDLTFQDFMFGFQTKPYSSSFEGKHLAERLDHLEVLESTPQAVHAAIKQKQNGK